MAEPHETGALRNKRAELAGTPRQLEQQLAGHRANLAHLDATMRLFDPDVRPKDIRPRRDPGARRLVPARKMPAPDLRRVARSHSAGDDGELVERIMRVKAIPGADDHQRELIQKTLLGSLNRATETIEWLETAGVVSGRLI